MSSWVVDAIPPDVLTSAKTEATRRLVDAALGVTTSDTSADRDLQFAAEALELATLDQLENQSSPEVVTQTSSDAFALFRARRRLEDPLSLGMDLVRQSALGVLGDRGADVRRLLLEAEWLRLPLESADWGERTLATIIDAWLRLFRKDGWQDLRSVQQRILALRRSQEALEPGYLDALENSARPASARTAAYRLMVLYHMAKAAEVLALYMTQGHSGDGFDVREQLQAQFDAALIACARADLMDWDGLVRLLSYTAQRLVDNSIWTSTRAVNSRVSAFVERLVSPDAERPIFELLPPQRQALREVGIRGGERAVVVNLPTSSGKTFIAEFRILQALNQFEAQRGWVAYLAPTRALVGQVCVRLRRDFAGLGIGVERVSPALEIDGLEASLLKDRTDDNLFRVLVTTPEKLDLMIRGGWEAEIGRPLTLVVVDEAHNLADGERGIRLELLLATINRECRNAQFLLLTPFIRNAREVSSWLSPESNATVELSVDWQPNDRIVGIVTARPLNGRPFSVDLETVHTSRSTLTVPNRLPLTRGRPLGLTWAQVRSNASALAAATAQILKNRGPTIVLAGRPDWTWGLAQRLVRPENRRPTNEDIELVQGYLALEFGEAFDLINLLEHRVGVHHSGLSDEAKALMEWLFERGHLDVLVATTTIAQGVNFPVSSVVVAHHLQYDGKRMVPMNTADFWNLAGRAGRADQAAPGVVALVAIDDQRAASLRGYVNEQVLALNSTLITMVEEAVAASGSLELHSLFYRPEWSAFLQYLAHTYRQVGDPERFASQIDRILRGTFGFHKLRESNRVLAQILVEGAQAYGSRLANKPLKLVDSTGFSWESVSWTLARLSEERISEDVWDPATLYSTRSTGLQKLMGILLTVPELRENLGAATGSRRPDGNTLARMLKDWVGGASLADMASEYFGRSQSGEPVSSTESLTECCRNVFGKLTQTSSWGLAALQAMTLREDFDRLTVEQQATIRNLPSRALYGVNSDEAIALRVLGIPRNAAQPLANILGPRVLAESLPALRRELSQAGDTLWDQALGTAARYYRTVWTVLEGSR